MKRDDKINRLSHWWREVEAHSHDDEQLQRKLHLMEAELKHVLRERAGGSPQWKRNLAATTVLLAVIALAVGMLRFIGVPEAYRPGPAETATVAARSDASFIKAASRLPAGEVTTTSASPASKALPPAGTTKPRRIVRSRPPATAADPTEEAAPAATGEESTAVPAAAPASPSAPSEAPDTAPSGDHGLDALALLSALESEFEK
jgi:hypothetical protein